MSTSARPFARSQRGFSLIEVLIGLLIAMIGVVIMMEVLITSEQRTRTTTGGNDATSSGAVMLHLMQRDLVQAGYGINSVALLGCNLTLPNGKTIPLAPVAINPATSVIPAGDPNTDRLLVFYGSDTGQPEGNTVYSLAGSTYTVQAPTAFKVNDYVVASTGSCTGTLTLARITAVSALDVTVSSAVAGATTLYNMGQTPHVVAYAVRNGALTSCDYMNADCSNASAANWTALSGNIVSLRAQYGRDTAVGAMDGVVDQWDQTTPASSCQWVRASAVRYAIVARNQNYETKIDATGQRTCEQVTTGAPSWQGATATSPSQTLAIDLTKKPDGSAATDWQCYRYRTFENVAPSRNVVWMGAPAGC
jgi:type IV pilus assembly protein PilW